MSFAPNLLDALGQRIVRDRDTGPALVHHLIAPNHSAAMGHEKSEYGCCTRSKEFPMKTCHPPTAATLKLINAVACALALAMPAAPIHAGGHEQLFQHAVHQYKAGRYSEAYGKFIELANHGDSDAAHIALFMHKYGPTLYGSWWDADPTDLAQWSTLLRDKGGRLQPVFVPDPYAISPREKAAALKSGALGVARKQASRP